MCIHVSAESATTNDIMTNKSSVVLLPVEVFRQCALHKMYFN